jgi:hypothetical protein
MTDKEQQQPCKRCGGTGNSPIDAEYDCGQCNGTGFHAAPPPAGTDGEGRALRRTIARLAVPRVDPDAVYAVRYTINHAGEKLHGEWLIRGRDLTEPQIIDLAVRGVFDDA